MDEDKVDQAEDATAEVTAESTTDGEKAAELTTSKRKRAIAIAALCVVAVALAGGIAWGATAQKPHAEDPQKTSEITQAEPSQTTSLDIKANHEGWAKSDGLARVKVKKSNGEVVVEKEIELNETVRVADLEPGSYKVELMPPVLADGTIFASLSSASLDIAEEGLEQAEDMAVHDIENHAATLEVTLQPIPEADTTEGLIDTAVNAYAKDNAEKESLKARAMAKMKSYQDKKAEEQKAAEEAAANGTATPEQIAAVEAAGGYVAPGSYANAGTGDADSSGSGGTSTGGSPSSGGAVDTGGGSSSGGGGTATETPSAPADDRYEGNPKYGYWTAVWTYWCNTCSASFNTEEAAAAHVQASADAWGAGDNSAMCSGYSGSSKSTWIWY